MVPPLDRHGEVEVVEINHDLARQLRTSEGVAQLITYLKMGSFPVGLLINFNVRRLREGIMRRVV